jgi:hypothetical protein
LYFQLQVSALRTEGTGFGLLPTTQARDWKGAPGPNSHNVSLPGLLKTPSAMAKLGLLPTPTAQDGQKNALLPPSQVNRNDSIVKRILEVDPQAGQTSQLNPRFVAEMMGFPPDWTELPFQSGETNRSKPTATP